MTVQLIFCSIFFKANITFVHRINLSIYLEFEKTCAIDTVMSDKV